MITVEIERYIIYEDADLIALNKPARLVVHPTYRHPRGSGTVWDGLIELFARRGWPHQPGMVHRLDRPTSGLLVVAKYPAVLQALARQFHDRTVHKGYLALAHYAANKQLPVAGTIDIPLGRDRDNWRYVRPTDVTAGGQAARTRYRIVRSWPTAGRMLVRLWPETGRTHQLRVHLAQLGCPIEGDPLYGDYDQHDDVDERWQQRLWLHADRLTLHLPTTRMPVTLRAPLPDDFRLHVDKLNTDRLSRLIRHTS